MDEVALLVEKVMPVKQGEGVTWMGRDGKWLLGPGANRGVAWLFIGHETWPGEKNACMA